MPSLATSAVEPTTSAPSAPAGELANATIADAAMTQPRLIIYAPPGVVSGYCRFCRRATFVVAPTSAVAPAPSQHQRDPLVERDARFEFQPLHAVGGDRRRRLGGEQPGQDDVPARGNRARDRRGEPPQ